MPKATKKSASAKLPRERVSVDFVILADFAQAVNGKLTVVGAGWNMINARGYPLTLPFGLGIGILVPWAETNRRHPFSFQIRGEAGVQLASGGGEVEAGREPGMPAGMTQRVVMGFSGQLTITAAGTYEVIVTAGDDRKKLVFEAMPVPQLRLGPP